MEWFKQALIMDDVDVYLQMLTSTTGDALG